MKAAAIEKENLPQKGAKPVHDDYRVRVFAFNAILPFARPAPLCGYSSVEMH